jgi:hypothetical protein
MPEIYQVTTQAQLSRAFPQISSNTVHPAFSVTEYLDNGSYAQIEKFPSSTPASYSDSQTLIVGASEQPVLGPIYMKQVVKVREKGKAQ